MSSACLACLYAAPSPVCGDGVHICFLPRGHAGQCRCDDCGQPFDPAEIQPEPDPPIILDNSKIIP